MWGNIAIAFLLAFIVSFVATPYTIKIANKIGAVDVPKDKRRMHTKAMPKFGGPAVILGSTKRNPHRRTFRQKYRRVRANAACCSRAQRNELLDSPNTRYRSKM